MNQSAAIQSAETLAALRAAVAGEHRLATRCEDRFARYYLGFTHRMLASIWPQSLLRLLLRWKAPGSYGFTIARTRPFDEALLSAITSQVEQVIILGAGYDSRSFRFCDALQGVHVIEVDHPATQRRKRSILARTATKPPARLTYLSLDLTKDCLKAAWARHYLRQDRRTLVLWEGVSYYLPQAAVANVLDFVSRFAPGSSIVFDYATQQFVDGDNSTYGSKQVASWLERIGEPFLFGLHPEEAKDFLAEHHLQLVSNLGPEDLERSYLKTRNGRLLSRSLGHVRIAQAVVVPVSDGTLRGRDQ